MTPGERIKREREALGMSRPDLARAARVPYPTLAGIEGGHQSSSTKLHAIAGALNLNPDWIETGKGSKRPVQPIPASQSVSDIRSKMTLAAEMVLDQFDRWGITLRPKEDADLITGVFDILMQPADNNVVVVTRWLAEQVEARGLGNVGQSKVGSNSGEDRRTDTAAPGRKAKAAAGHKG